MIKNIIFDLGNVLIDFHPIEHLKTKKLSEKQREIVYRAIFLSEEWVELDKGTMTREEALESIYLKNPDDRALLSENTDFENILIPIEVNVKIFKELKEQGYKLYYLTNYHEDLFEYTYNKFEFFKNFDGGIVSAHVKMIKPDFEIYHELLNQYNLTPSETLFIDDTEKNTIAAESLGISAIHLEERNSLRNQLKMIL